MQPVYIQGVSSLSVDDFGGLAACDAMQNTEHRFSPSVFLDGFNPRGQIPMMKLRRLDRASRMVICTLEPLVRNRDCSDWGLYLGTFSAGSDAIEKFMTRYLKDGPLGANPMVFPNTVLNASVGNAAIYYGMHGPNSMACQNLIAGPAAIQAACHYLQFHPEQTLITGGVDVISEHQFAIWSSHEDYAKGYVIGEGCALLRLTREEGDVAITAFTQGRVDIPPHRFPNEADQLQQVIQRHWRRYGEPDRLYDFATRDPRHQAAFDVLASGIPRRSLIGEVGLGSFVGAYAVVAAHGELESGQCADVLGLGLGGDYLLTRVEKS